MKKSLSVVLSLVFSVMVMGYAYAQAPAAPEAPKAPEAAATTEVKAEVKAAVTEEVLVGKFVEKDGKAMIAVEGKDAVAVKVDAKVEEVKKVEKFADKTFEFKGTFVTEKVKEGDKEVEAKLFVIASFGEKAAEAPKAPEAPKEEKK